MLCLTNAFSESQLSQGWAAGSGQEQCWDAQKGVACPVHAWGLYPFPQERADLSTMALCLAPPTSFPTQPQDFWGVCSLHQEGLLLGDGALPDLAFPIWVLSPGLSFAPPPLCGAAPAGLASSSPRELGTFRGLTVLFPLLSMFHVLPHTGPLPGHSVCLAKAQE